MKVSITAIILTYNEESNLPKVLESIKGLTSQIIVVDSYSTDKTKEIALKCGAEFYEHPFKNQAEQFNWALDNLNIKNEWILKLDADEYILPELAKEIEETLRNTNLLRKYETEGVNGFYIKRRVYFMNKWIKHGGYYPIWFLRLFRKGMGRSENRKVDEHIVLTGGNSEKLENDFVDENKKGLKVWIEKHKDYAKREAQEILSGAKNINSKQQFYYELPIFIRPFIYFFYRYFLKLGFLDGVRGTIFHFLQGFWYRFLVDVNIYKMKQNQQSID